MKSKRDNQRINKAIDALIKIQDSGHGNYIIQRILDLLNEERSKS